MDPMDTVLAWDQSLRAGDWEAARALLADDATYTPPEGSEQAAVRCESPDQIVEFLRSLKGTLPDVEVVEWETIDDRVLARLRQPAFGDDSDWFQVLTVRDGLILRLEDHPTRPEAEQAARGA